MILLSRRLHVFRGVAQLGEHYTMQLALFAHSANVAVSSVTVSDLQLGTGAGVIPSTNSHCMNTNGTDYWGRAYHADAGATTVEQGDVLALWLSITIPAGTSPGIYRGTAAVRLQNETTLLVHQIEITVVGPALTDGGDAQQWRGTVPLQSHTVIKGTVTKATATKGMATKGMVTKAIGTAPPQSHIVWHPPFFFIKMALA